MKDGCYYGIFVEQNAVIQKKENIMEAAVIKDIKKILPWFISHKNI
jgi:hypothetical protein